MYAPVFKSVACELCPEGKLSSADRTLCTDCKVHAREK